jgi:hypothetical protein
MCCAVLVAGVRVEATPEAHEELRALAAPSIARSRLPHELNQNLTRQVLTQARI